MSLILERPLTPAQIQKRQDKSNKMLSDKINKAYDYLLTDLMRRLSELENKRAKKVK